MKIAVGQINPKVGDIEYNKNKIIEQVVKLQDADLIVFGELAVCGAPTYDLVSSEGFVDRAIDAVSDIAEIAQGVDLLIGAPTMNDGDFFSTVFHISNGEIVGEFSKAMITSRDEVPYYSGVESAAFPEGTPLENVIRVNDELVLLSIGEDFDFIDELDLFDGIKNFEAVVNLRAQRYVHGVGYQMTRSVGQKAKEIGFPIIVANLVGGSDDLVYYGGSFAVNTNGDLIIKARNFAEDGFILDTWDADSFGAIPNKKPTPKAKIKDLYAALVMAISDYFSKKGFEKACLGLSGGVDSALVAALAVKALGPQNVTGLLMPSQFSSDHSVADALELARNLGIEHHIVPIEPMYAAYTAALSPLFGDLPFSVAEENLQSRIRGGLLMAYSNKFGHIVLNTTNKCEAAMGYGTLYGDTNGAISVLGDIYKGEVYDLCRLINEQQEVIPLNIFTKAPSAELRPGQKDSDSLPEYHLLDRILYGLIEQCKSVEELQEEGLDREMVAKTLRMLTASEYKRHQLPPSIRVSEVVLTKDIYLPV